MGDAANLTPMFRQYRAHKRSHPDAILLFRMGDFYEMFYEDAQLASRLLELTLTARGKGTDNVVPMCGFPHHQLDSYTAKLVRASQRVAICDQVEDPRLARGLVRREVVRIVTPGTVNDPQQIEAKANVWLAAVAAAAGRLGAAFVDASTGEFLAWEAEGDDEAQSRALADRLLAFSPAEIVHPDDADWPARLGALLGEPAGAPTRGAGGLRGITLSAAEAYGFTLAAAAPLVERQCGVASLDGFGLRDRPAAVAAAGGLLRYVQDTQRCGLEHVDRVVLHEPARHLLLDPATRRNLELERSLRDGGRGGSLFQVLDRTESAGGGRLLRHWLLAPLIDAVEIGRRHDAVGELVRRGELRGEAREVLAGVHDVERLLARAVAGTAGPRELLALRASIERVPALRAALGPITAPLVTEALRGLDPCSDVAERIGRGLCDEPPATLRDGGVIRDGFDPRLDELRSLRRDGRSFIVSLEARERQATGIASLKVRFNKVFGYYLEVSKANLHLVPERYQRKQTIAGGERYATPELKEHEEKVLNAEERIEALELELFAALRAEVAAAAPRLKALARVLALADVLAALADLAAANGYCRPEVDDSGRLAIAGGRHPVVEHALRDGRFVPNDTSLEARARAIAVLTGPNMGGKSTYLRQVALIVLMAQAGSFVPADSATIGLVDRIFCRVGASDSLGEGQSTFMVEMTETANILHHATARSLILLDEIGRGTATFDGLSIAWAVVEHLHALEGGAPRTLFATHYHELTELAVELEGVLNLRMQVREWGDRVVFLHRVEPGAADRSYGIQVARLAGIPRRVLERAREILINLERDEYGRDGLPRRARRSGGERERRQPSLFAWSEPTAAAEPVDPVAGEVLAELRQEDPDRLTPLDALQRIADWRKRLGGAATDADPESQG